MVGAKGSKIVVTTRKAKVASIMGNNSPYILKGLEENQSWNLFSKFAFREGLEHVHPNIIEIGKEIAKMCKGVPLIIKTVGAILQFESEERYWLSIKNNENLLSLGDENDNVLSILKLSYDNLPTHLRQCFGYCALFPKDYEIKKRLLVQLWIAQGYIQTSYKNENLEDVGDQYFKELLSRSLLEEGKKDVFDNILSCKMHDLIHDLAQAVAGPEILILRESETNILEKVRHVSLCDWKNPMIKTSKTKPIRTFLKLYGVWFEDVSIINSVILSFKCLRVLSLDGLNLKEVPKCLGKLSHLRYLDLSSNSFVVLPNSITKLKNLQTLKVNDCLNLERFPKFTRKLINLRHLENGECFNLTHMPYGIGELTLLESLPFFIVGTGTGQAGDHKIGSLCELKRLNQLRGELRIRKLAGERDVSRVPRGEILKGKQYLRSLRLDWLPRCPPEEGNRDVNDALVMEGLQPHPHLMELYIRGYGGRRFPSWMMNDGLGSLLPNLIIIKIQGCSRCQILPPFSQLASLQSLELTDMAEVEEMEADSSATLFFPSLQFLQLSRLPKLKGLWTAKAEQGPSFVCLSKLGISDCSNLTSTHLPSSPSLSELSIWSCPKLISLQLHSSSCLSLSTLEIRHCYNLTSLELPSSPCLSELDIRDCLNLTSFELHSSPSLSVLCILSCSKLISLQLHSSSSLSLSTLEIRHCHNLTSLELPSSPCLSKLDIQDCLNLTSLELHSSPRLSQLHIQDCLNLTSFELHSSPSVSVLCILSCSKLISLQLHSSSSLQSLTIYDCPELMTSLPREMPSLKTLQKLGIANCSGLATLPHWMGSLTSLTELEINNWPQLATLPRYIGSLTSLIQLYIWCCPELTSLPEEMRSLKNLQELSIQFCPHLEKRCQKETGEDWPKISHIPHIRIS